MNNLFIEGIPGSGKSTLLNTLGKELPKYTVYREGDLSPVELAWCSYMHKKQFAKIVEKYPEIKNELSQWTIEEGDYRVTAYTRILTDRAGFHQYMERFEIYNGNIPFEDFERIILQRYSTFDEDGNIFECSLFQNSIECMMLFYEMSDEQIMKFYEALWKKIKCAKLIYLNTQNIEETILHVKEERTDESGKEMWFPLVVRFVEESPYGKKHELRGINGVVSHLIRRKELEIKIIEKVIKEDALIVESKHYEIGELLERCKE